MQKTNKIRFISAYYKNICIIIGFVSSIKITNPLLETQTVAKALLSADYSNKNILLLQGPVGVFFPICPRICARMAIAYSKLTSMPEMFCFTLERIISEVSGQNFLLIYNSLLHNTTLTQWFCLAIAAPFIRKL